MRRINRCLNTKLLELCQRAIQLEELNKQLYHTLPESLHQHCRMGSFNAGCLTIVANDAVWASQLRYYLPELRDKLRREAGLYQLVAIKVTVNQNNEALAIKRASRIQLSPKARDIILASSEQFHYKPLQDAWYQLANQGAKDPEKPGSAG